MGVGVRAAGARLVVARAAGRGQQARGRRAEDGEERNTAGEDNGTPRAAHPAVRPYDHVLLDLDGCLWVGDEALPGAADAVAALREAGKSVVFLTNDVRHAPEEFVRKLWRLGFQASLDEVVTVGAAVQYALAARAAAARRSWSARRRWSTTSPRPACGSSTARRSPPRADVVVVGGHDALVFEELKIAAQAVLRGAELIGATRDPNFPMPDGPWPGSGAVLAAIETASRPHAPTTVVGKPEPPMYEAARDRLGAGPRARRRRPARRRRGGRAPRRDGLRAGAHRRHHARARRRRAQPPPTPRRRLARQRWCLRRAG